MARSIWSGSISFGLVNIPVRLYAAVAPKDVHFHQLHDADGARIELKRFCSAENKEVPYEHIVKGYELTPQQYVTIRREELDALDPKATRTIEIESFADLSEIDLLYYEHSYYLAPADKGAQKAYALLLDAMEKAGKIAIARSVMRTRQYLAALRPTRRVLTMSTLYYVDEVTDASELEGLPGADVHATEKESAMARQLVESLSSKLDLKKYHDTYRERVLELIERKAAGEKIVASAAAPEPAKVVDLMAALEASLATTRKGAAPARRPAEHRKGERRRRTA